MKDEVRLINEGERERFCKQLGNATEKMKKEPRMVIFFDKSKDGDMTTKGREHHLPLPGAHSFVVIMHDPTNPFNIFRNLHQLQYFINCLSQKGGHRKSFFL